MQIIFQAMERGNLEAVIPGIPVIGILLQRVVYIGLFIIPNPLSSQ